MQEIIESLDRRLRYLEHIVKQLSEVCKQLSERIDASESKGIPSDGIE